MNVELEGIFLTYIMHLYNSKGTENGNYFLVFMSLVFHCIATVAIYSEADKDALHTQIADEAIFPIGLLINRGFRDQRLP